jgi:hypothetical protein
MDATHMMSKSGGRDFAFGGVEEAWSAATDPHHIRYSSAPCAAASRSVEYLAQCGVGVTSRPSLYEATLNIA